MEKHEGIKCLGQLAAFCLAVGGCIGTLSYRFPPKEHIDKYSIFNGDVNVIRTETTRSSILGDKSIYSVNLEMEIHKSGEYLFEGWQRRHRASDVSGDKWNYSVNEIPFEDKKDLHSLIYRLESTRINEEGKIERDTLKFNHYGISGAFKASGSPTE